MYISQEDALKQERASYPTPGHILRTERMNDGFTKIFIEESGRPFHYFDKPDAGDPHDHPFSMTSHVVVGGYVEEVYTIHSDGTYTIERIERRPGTSHRVEAYDIHRIVELLGTHCLTHVEPEARVQDWAFYRFDEQGIWQRRPDEAEFALLAARKLVA